PSKIRKLCDELLECHRGLKRPLADRMEAGLTEKAIAKLTAKLPFQLPRSAIELYMWRNGLARPIPESSPICPTLLYVYEMWTLRESVESYLRLSSIEEVEWEPEWFPILQEGRNYLAVVCAGREALDAPVIRFAGELGPKTAFRSVERML